MSRGSRRPPTSHGQSCQPGHGGLSDAFVVKIADDVGSAVIARKYQDLGGPSGLLGGPVGPEFINRMASGGANSMTRALSTGVPPLEHMPY